MAGYSYRSIGDNVEADMAAGLMTAKVVCLIESLFEYRYLFCELLLPSSMLSLVMKSSFYEFKKFAGLSLQNIHHNWNALIVPFQYKDLCLFYIILLLELEFFIVSLLLFPLWKSSYLVQKKLLFPIL